MAETFNFPEVADDYLRTPNIVSHCIINAITQLNIPTDTKSVEMCLTLNGQEVSLRDFLNKFQEHHDQMLAQEAERLLKDKLGKLQDAVYRLEQEAERALLDITREKE